MAVEEADRALTGNAGALGIVATALVALLGSARMVPFIMGDDGWARLPNLHRLDDEIAARPAAARWTP